MESHKKEGKGLQTNCSWWRRRRNRRVGVVERWDRRFGVGGKKRMDRRVGVGGRRRMDRVGGVGGMK